MTAKNMKCILALLLESSVKDSHGLKELDLLKKKD